MSLSLPTFIFTDKFSGKKEDWPQFRTNFLTLIYTVIIQGQLFGLLGWILSDPEFANLPGQMAANVPFVAPVLDVLLPDLIPDTPTNRSANLAARAAHQKATDAHLYPTQCLNAFKVLFYDALNEEGQSVARGLSINGIMFLTLRDMLARIDAHYGVLNTNELRIALAPLRAPYVEGTSIMELLLIHQKGHATYLKHDSSHQPYSDFIKIDMLTQVLVNHVYYANEIEHFQRSQPDRTLQTYANFHLMLIQAEGRLASTLQMDNLSRQANATSAARPFPERTTTAKRVAANDDPVVVVGPGYCHTHGRGATHSSSDCSNQAVGHNKAATAANHMGGNSKTWAETPRNSSYRKRAANATK
jgi:hypothetical protein